MIPFSSPRPRLGVAHAPKILDSEMPLLTIEILEATSRSTSAPALARTADLRTYAVAEEAWFFKQDRLFGERQLQNRN